MRVDKTDGLAYSLDDFIVQYGGSYEDPPAEWAEAPYSHGRRGGGGSGQQVCSPADVCDGDPGAEKTGYVCTICGDDTARWGVWAPCGHHACWKCTLRVRFIFPDDSKARLCCICQQEAETVVITERPPPGLGERQDPDDAYDLAVFDFARTLRDHKWGIPCTEQASMRAVESLRRPFCPLWRECGARRAFHCMKDLDQHLWDQHSKAHCRVCREGSRNFLSELSLYTEVELEEHGRGKLAREMHFPGHPHCHFCRQDQYDDEALMAHLHHRHEVCVLCDRGSEARPILHFCRHVDALESHLRDKHILCPTCSEQYKAARRSGRVDRHPTEFAFRLEVDYRKHMMDVHGKSAGAVNVSELLGFTYGKGQQGGGKGGKKGAGHGGGDSGGEEEGLGATTVFFEFPGRQPKRVRMGGTPTVPAARSAGSPAAAGQDEGLTALLAERLSAGCPGGEAAASALLMGIPDFLADRKHAREFYQRLQAALGDELEEIFGAVVDAVPAADQRQALQLLHNQATTTEVGGEKGARPLPVADDGTAAGVDYPTLKGDTSPARQASPQRRSPQRKPDREPPHWAAAAGSTQWAAASLGRGRGAPVALDGADFPSLAGGRAAPAPSAAPTWGARGGGSAVRAPPPPQPTGGGGGGRAGSPDGRPAPAPAPAPAKAATEYCHACDGKGRVKGKKCDACNGAGEVTVVAEGPVRGAGPTLADFVGASTKRGKKKGGAAPAPAEQPEGAASGGAPREPRPRPQQRRAERPAQPAEEYPSLGSAAGAPARGAPPPRSGAWAAKAGAQAKPAAPPAAAHADPWATADAPPPRGGSPGRAAPEGSAKDAALAALAAAPPKMDSAADFPSLAAPQGGKKGKRQQQPAAVPGAAGAQAAGGRWVVPPKVRS